MSRIAPIDPANATGKARELFDGPLKGKHFNIFKSMAASPAVLEMYVAIGAALKHASLSAKEREVVQLAIAEAQHCDYCTAAHTAVAKGAGLTHAETIEARRGKMIDPKLGAVARFALAIHEKKGCVSDPDIASFRAAGYTDAHIAEVVGAYSQMLFTSTFNHVNDTPVDFPPAPPL